MPSNSPHYSGSVVPEKETARRAQLQQGWAVLCRKGDLDVFSFTSFDRVHMSTSVNDKIRAADCTAICMSQ